MSETATAAPPKCVGCGQLLFGGWAVVGGPDGRTYCQRCFSEKFAKCEWCGLVVPREDLRAAPDSGKLICSACWDDTFVVCDSCGEVVDRDHAYPTPDGELYCELCWDECCTSCIACGETLWREDAIYTPSGDGPYCPGCAPEGIIREYGYKPRPEPEKEAYENTLYLGVELEVECEDDPEDVAETLTDYLPENVTRKERVYFKHDGSLDNGFEVVFHPTTWKKWHSYSPTNVVTAIWEAGGYAKGTCGIHIHLSRDFLGRQGLDRLAVFFTNAWEPICRLAGRRDSSWARLRPWTALDVARSIPYETASRYSAVNTATHERTVELRVFASTTDPLRFIAYLQFADAAAHFARMYSALAMTWPVFCGWLEQTNRYGHLIQYMKMLGIWVPYWKRKKGRRWSLSVSTHRQTQGS